MQQHFSFLAPLSKEFGGDVNKNKRKAKRPLSSKVPIHLVLKSEKAVRLHSFLHKERKIRDLIYTTGKKHGVRIYKEAIHTNHIHLILKISHERAYKAWIRHLTSAIAKLIKQGFTQKPYTRIASWGREFKTLLDYLHTNILEVNGFPCRVATKRKAKHSSPLPIG